MISSGVNDRLVFRLGFHYSFSGRGKGVNRGSIRLSFQG